MNRTSQIEKERDIMEIQLQRQQDEMQHLQQQYEEISILRHDFRNGIDCLCGMIEQGDCSGALAYAKQFKERKVNTVKASMISPREISCGLLARCSKPFPPKNNRAESLQASSQFYNIFIKMLTINFAVNESVILCCNAKTTRNLSCSIVWEKVLYANSIFR